MTEITKCDNEEHVLNTLKGLHWLDGVGSGSLLVDFDTALESIARPNKHTLQFTVHPTNTSQWTFKRYGIDEMFWNIVSLKYRFTIDTITGMCEILPIFGDNSGSPMNRLTRWGLLGKGSLLKFYMYPSDNDTDTGLFIRDTNVTLFGKEFNVNTYYVKRIIGRGGTTDYFAGFSSIVDDRDVGLIKNALKY